MGCELISNFQLSTFNFKFKKFLTNKALPYPIFVSPFQGLIPNLGRDKSTSLQQPLTAKQKNQGRHKNDSPKNYALCIMNYALFIVSLMSLDMCWLDVHLLAVEQ